MQRDRAGGDQAERDRAEGRPPRLGRVARCLTGELDEHAADAAAHADRHLGDDRADHGVRRGEPQRRQQVGHGGREAAAHERRPVAGRVGAHEVDVDAVGRLRVRAALRSATGKNARYDAMSATDSHCGHGRAAAVDLVADRVHDRARTR